MHSMHKVVSRIIRAMGTPLAHKAHALWLKEDYAQLINLNINPGDYARAESYALDAQVISTFRKLEGLPTGIDLKQKAVDSFFACEKMCQLTNNRWASYSNWFERGFHGDEKDEKLFLHLRYVRDMIADALGPIPKDLTPVFSNGSTFNDRGDEITIPHKMGSRPTVSSNAWGIIRDLWMPTAWARACDLSPEVVFGNRFTTVPKDSSKHRGICIEPSLNVTYQLSVGKHIKRRLVRLGIDIDGATLAVTAQESHRHAAQKASVDGLNATLDLSNASDTVAYMVVKTLLPKGWFDLLAALRSPSTHINGKWVKTHKFSSMGCGFTFELETLIFWALSQSVSTGKVSTYGDDIILPTVDSRCAISLLTLAGFQINNTKSFYDSLDPFRESCGGDFFNGQAVRPVYLKSIPTKPSEWIVLANLIQKIRKNLISSCNISLLEEAWRLCVNEVARPYRLFGPSWAGDMVIHSEDRTRWRTRPHKKGGLDCGFMDLMVLDTKLFRVSLKNFSGRVQLASALLGTPSKGPVPRDGISGYRTAWRPTVM